MKHPDYPPGMLWRATLVPDTHGKFLRLEMVDTTGLLDYAIRELCASRMGIIQDFKAERLHRGEPLHCDFDQHAMQDQPGVIIMRGNLHDLETIAARFDNQPKHAHSPDAKTRARGSHLKLVASGGVLLD